MTTFTVDPDPTPAPEASTSPFPASDAEAVKAAAPAGETPVILSSSARADIDFEITRRNDVFRDEAIEAAQFETGVDEYTVVTDIPVATRLHPTDRTKRVETFKVGTGPVAANALSVPADPDPDPFDGTVPAPAAPFDAPVAEDVVL